MNDFTLLESYIKTFLTYLVPFFSRSVGQFHHSRQLSLSQGLYHNLGVYDKSLEELYANGTVVQVSGL